MQIQEYGFYHINEWVKLKGSGIVHNPAFLLIDVYVFCKSFIYDRIGSFWICLYENMGGFICFKNEG